MNSEFDTLFKQFRHNYETTFPPPRYRIASLLGWQFVLSVIWALFAVIMVSSQTASEFYIAKVMSGMNQTLAILASGSVLFAIEGGIVIGASIKAATKRHYDVRLINIAIGLSVLISIIAGINSTIGIIEDVDGNMLYDLRLGMVFIMGIGGSLVAWASGEVVGSQLAKAFLDRDVARAKFEERLNDYNERLLAAWHRSPEYVLAQADIRDGADSILERRKSRKKNEPIQYQEQHSSAVHYRRLSTEDKTKILHLSTAQVMQEFGITVERTAQNWKSFAKRDRDAGLLK